MPMKMCCTCPAYTEVKLHPGGAVHPMGVQPDHGFCCLNPKSEPKRSDEFCMQHPLLRPEMWPHVLRKPEVRS